MRVVLPGALPYAVIYPTDRCSKKIAGIFKSGKRVKRI
jgi:hypothetical protein